MQALWRQIDELHAALVPGYFRASGPGASLGGGPGARPSPRFADDPHATMLVAEASASSGPGAAPVIGAVLVRAYDTPSDPAMVPRRRVHVEALVVDQRRRRAGVGTALMDAAVTWAREHGATEIVLTVWAGNQAAEAFYQRLGYQIISRALSKQIQG
ncbi:MAG TPA: GNAT family N-acetyltransferase [Polyangia bacterium]|nr:GNAT family N-acetyltransferase [Polyangia bacterium]